MTCALQSIKSTYKRHRIRKENTVPILVRPLPHVSVPLPFQFDSVPSSVRPPRVPSDVLSRHP